MTKPIATFKKKGPFMCLDGAGRAASGGNYSQQKLCLVATDRAFLAAFLLELSNHPNCYFVKFSVEPRDGMYLGRCFFTDAQTAGEKCRELKAHPKLMVTLQDDDFFKPFRKN